jgi:hypothetical protein
VGALFRSVRCIHINHVCESMERHTALPQAGPAETWLITTTGRRRKVNQLYRQN